ncbi:hypothetical protein ANANG_G00253920 [Anguilla anguilla]|uniref:WW domain-containing protein n=1 Tax=Anguilla anguilla TaxID=7936 RepID=A0A9D3LSS5_ANGAN|nr:hypothetical protein ANANG_G00253920 [Anguilla anguilla]
MASENHGTVKGEPALVMSPSGPSSSQGQPLLPSTSKPIQELPDELIQAGWSKCWSKRENRPYYFNRFTNQSLWEVPVLGQHDVIVSAARHKQRAAEKDPVRRETAPHPQKTSQALQARPLRGKIWRSFRRKSVM